MLQYLVDLDTKTYQKTSQFLLLDELVELKQYGLNVFCSKKKPDASFQEDKYLLIRINDTASLMTLLPRLEDTLFDLSLNNTKGVYLYKEVGAGYNLAATDVLDWKELQARALKKERLVIRAFPLTDHSGDSLRPIIEEALYELRNISDGDLAAYIEKYKIRQ